jgi:hypothetical protein
MRRLHEIVQLALEILGLLVTAAGTGFVVSWWLGWGGLLGAGVVLLAAAYRAERDLHPPKPKPSKPPPVTTSKSNGEVEDEGLLDRLKHLIKT